MEINKLCKGCNFLNHKIECLVKYSEELTDICPCRNCLIKSMCSVKCKKRLDLHYNDFIIRRYYKF